LHNAWHVYSACPSPLPHTSKCIYRLRLLCKSFFLKRWIRQHLHRAPSTTTNKGRTGPEKKNLDAAAHVSENISKGFTIEPSEFRRWSYPLINAISFMIKLEYLSSTPHEEDRWQILWVWDKLTRSWTEASMQTW
jgi:hypothetical protein